jgi:hypothetical protein
MASYDNKADTGGGNGTAKTMNAGGGGKSIAEKSIGEKSFSDRIDMIDMKQVASLASMPPLTGADTQAGEKARKSFGSELVKYAAYRDNDGSEISKGVFQGMVYGTRTERADYIKKRAETLSFGNDELLPSKIESQLKTQNEIAQRLTRFRHIMTSKSSASWWSNNAGSTAIRAFAKKYIDGTLSAQDAKTIFGL